MQYYSPVVAFSLPIPSRSQYLSVAMNFTAQILPSMQQRKMRTSNGHAGTGTLDLELQGYINIVTDISASNTAHHWLQCSMKNQAHHKEHLAAIFVGQKKQPDDGRVWHLVVKGLTMQL